jgi:hypothetical protein
MYIFVTGSEAALYVSSFLLTAKYWYDVEGGWNHEAEIPWVQGRFEGVQQAPSKDGIVRVHHINHVEGYIPCAWILWCAKWGGQGYDPDGFNSFSVEVIERLCRLFELLFVIGQQEKDFSLTAIVDEDSGDVPPINVDGDNHGIGMWERS